MQIYVNKMVQRWSRTALLLTMAVLIAACGGTESTPEAAELPTAIPTTAPTAVPTAIPTIAPTVMAETQSTSPLDQPQSPLTQAESPLVTNVITKPRTEEEAIALAAVTTAPEPTDGFGSFSGLVYSFGGSPGAIPETQFYLVEATELDGRLIPPPIYLGPRPEEGDVYGATSALGQVQIGEIPPGNYYVAVWTLYGWLLAFPTPLEEQSPRLITIEAGDQLNLGVLYVNWP